MARTLTPTKLTMNDVLAWVTDARRVTPLGYFGDPASFNADKAKEEFEKLAKLMADAIENQIRNNESAIQNHQIHN